MNKPFLVKTLKNLMIFRIEYIFVSGISTFNFGNELSIIKFQVSLTPSFVKIFVKMEARISNFKNDSEDNID